MSSGKNFFSEAKALFELPFSSAAGDSFGRRRLCICNWCR